MARYDAKTSRKGQTTISRRGAAIDRSRTRRDGAVRHFRGGRCPCHREKEGAAGHQGTLRPWRSTPRHRTGHHRFGLGSDSAQAGRGRSMIGVDTNILLRHILADDPKWSEKSSRFLRDFCSPERPGYVNAVTLAEVAWVLRGRPEYEKAKLIQVVESLVADENLVLGSRERRRGRPRCVPPRARRFCRLPRGDAECRRWRHPDLHHRQKGAEASAVCSLALRTTAMPHRISRAAYAEMFGPTTGDRVRLADTELIVEVEQRLHHLWRGGEVRRRQGDPRRHGPEPDHPRRRRRRHGHHQRADHRPLGDRQGRYRHPATARLPASARPGIPTSSRASTSSSARAPRRSPARARSSPPAASTCTSISSARSRSTTR